VSFFYLILWPYFGYKAFTEGRSRHAGFSEGFASWKTVLQHSLTIAKDYITKRIMNQWFMQQTSADA